MKAAIIYHKADLDGVFSAAIAKSYEEELGNKISLFPYNYNEEIPPMEGFNAVYVVDMSFNDKTEEILYNWMNDGKFVYWIDHHRTAIFNPDGTMVAKDVPGIRTVGKGAMELTWMYRYQDDIVPQILKYLSAYDVWDKDRFDWHQVLMVEEAVQAKVGLDVEKAEKFLFEYPISILKLIEEGEYAWLVKTQLWETYCKMFAFEGKILGHPAIFMNTNEFRSEVFDSVWDKDKYDVMCPFCLQPNGHVRFSIYTDKEGVKANEIAKRLGGGGHDKAAGFLLTNPSDYMWFIKEHEIR